MDTSPEPDLASSPTSAPRDDVQEAIRRAFRLREPSRARRFAHIACFGFVGGCAVGQGWSRLPLGLVTAALAVVRLSDPPN